MRYLKRLQDSKLAIKEEFSWIAKFLDIQIQIPDGDLREQDLELLSKSAAALKQKRRPTIRQPAENEKDSERQAAYR